MSQSHKSTTAWAVGIVLAMGTLYLLSVPVLLNWIEYAEVRRTGNPNDWRPPPPWLIAYSTPHNILFIHTPLQRPLAIYLEWCQRWINGAHVL